MLVSSQHSHARRTPTCLGGDEPLGCIANGVSTPGDGGDACVIQQINVAGQCGTIDLQNAGGSLEASMPPELGAGAKVLWAVALYSAGQASTLTCTCAGQVIMDGMLQLKVVPWMRALITRMVALGPALAIVLYASSADAKFDLIQAVCEGANVLQATVPFALLREIFIRHCSRWRVRLGPLHTHLRGLRRSASWPPPSCCRRLRARYGDARSVGRIRPYPFGLPGAMHAARMERSRHVLQIQRLDHYSDVRSDCDRFVP